MKRNGNKNSVPRIANTCDSKDLDMALTPNWGESRGVKQFACSSSSRLHVELTKDFSLFQTFLLNSTLEKKNQTPTLFQRGHDPYENFFFNKSAFSIADRPYLAFISHCSLNNSHFKAEARGALLIPESSRLNMICSLLLHIDSLSLYSPLPECH